jgi:hypothetical protein
MRSQDAGARPHRARLAGGATPRVLGVESILCRRRRRRRGARWRDILTPRSLGSGLLAGAAARTGGVRDGHREIRRAAHDPIGVHGPHSPDTAARRHPPNRVNGGDTTRRPSPPLPRCWPTRHASDASQRQQSAEASPAATTARRITSRKLNHLEPRSAVDHDRALDDTEQRRDRCWMRFRSRGSAGGRCGARGLVECVGGRGGRVASGHALACRSGVIRVRGGCR